MSDSTPPSKKRVITVGNARPKRSKPGSFKRGSAQSGPRKYGGSKSGHGDAGEARYGKSKSGPSRPSPSKHGKPQHGKPRHGKGGSFKAGHKAGSFKRGETSEPGRPAQRRQSSYKPGSHRPGSHEPGRFQRKPAGSHRGGPSKGSTAPKPITKTRVKLRNFIVLDAVLKREEDFGYYQYALELADGTTIRVSSIAAEHTRLYSNLSARERAKPLTLLLYPKFDPQSSVGDSSSISGKVTRNVIALALGGIYRGWEDTPPSHLPKGLQTNMGYLTAKFLEPSGDGYGIFKIARKDDPTQMEHLSLDISQASTALKPEHWIDVQYSLEPIGEQFKLVVRDVVSQDANGAVAGWNDPCYTEPKTEEAIEAVEEEQPQRRRWRRVERPVKKGRFKYQVR